MNEYTDCVSNHSIIENIMVYIGGYHAYYICIDVSGNVWYDVVTENKLYRDYMEQHTCKYRENSYGYSVTWSTNEVMLNLDGVVIGRIRR